MIKKLTLSFIAVLVLAGVAYPAFAENMTLSADIGPCMQRAVEKRDTAIMGYHDTFQTGLKSALQTRMTDLKVAWGLTDKAQRKSAIKSAWEKFKTGRHTLRQALNTSRESSWKDFRADRIACKAPADGNGSSVDVL